MFDKFSGKGMKIGQRIFIFFIAMSIFMISAFIILVFVVNKLNLIAHNILRENVTSIESAYNLVTEALSLRGLKSNYMMDNNEKWLKDFDEHISNFNVWYQKAFDSAKTEEEKNILSVMAVDFERYVSIHKEIVKLYQSGQVEKAKELLLNESTTIFTEIQNGCNKLIDTNQNIIRVSELKAIEHSNRARFFGYLMLILFIVLGLILSFIMTKSIIDPLKEMENESVSVLGKKKEEPESGDEIDRLRKHFSAIISDLKSKQEELIQSEKKAAIGEVAAGISHEINNPLGVIFGYAEMLYKDKKIPKSQKSILKEILIQAGRCRNLIADILEFARQPQIRILNIDLSFLIKETIDMFKYQKKFRRVIFNFSSYSKKVMIKADPVKMKQVLVNIINNAAEAMKFSGQIEIKLTKQANYVIISIKDTGPGIPEKDLQNIFKPFFSTKPKGVGLGLPICKNIIERHKGEILVKNIPGSGAEFLIMIPEVKNERK